MSAPPQLPRLPALVDGVVSHTRFRPVRRRFANRVYQWLVDLDDLPAQPRYLRPFAGFSAQDHLGDPPLSIKQNVEQFLGLNGIVLGEGSRVVMLANARVLGHVFDPLSVYWCFTGSGDLRCVVAEVHNTYGQRHAYLLTPDASGRADTAKELYVSPFFDATGSYALQFSMSPARVSVVVRLTRDDSEGVAFSASFRGVPVPATRRAIAVRLVRKPLMSQQVSTLIRLYGIALWLRGLPIRHRPGHRPQAGV